MGNIIIIGAGGFGREVKCLIDEINNFNNKNYYNILGFVDDGLECNTKIHGLNVLGNLDYILSLKEKPSLVFGIGNPITKEKIFKKFEEFDFPIIKHPSISLEGKNIDIGKGSIICQGSILTCDIVISEFVTINLSCTIGHDTKVGNFSSLMPAVNLSGEVEIEKSVFIGTGVKIINQITIGAKTIIGAGAVVSKSLPSNCTALGIPARPIKYHI
jgi:sugar O-acyltransferase (sialic acid O-acetyltransferase NeuD family)